MTRAVSYTGDVEVTLDMRDGSRVKTLLRMGKQQRTLAQISERFRTSERADFSMAYRDTRGFKSVVSARPVVVSRKRINGAYQIIN